MKMYRYEENHMKKPPVSRPDLIEDVDHELFAAG